MRRLDHVPDALLADAVALMRILLLAVAAAARGRDLGAGER